MYVCFSSIACSIVYSVVCIVSYIFLGIQIMHYALCIVHYALN